MACNSGSYMPLIEAMLEDRLYTGSNDIQIRSAK